MPKTPSQKKRQRRKRLSTLQDEQQGPGRKRWARGGGTGPGDGLAGAPAAGGELRGPEGSAGKRSAAEGRPGPISCPRPVPLLRIAPVKARKPSDLFRLSLAVSSR